MMMSNKLTFFVAAVIAEKSFRGAAEIKSLISPTLMISKECGGHIVHEYLDMSSAQFILNVT